MKMDRESRIFECGGCLDGVKVMQGIDIHNLGISNKDICLICNECFVANFNV